jgi:hypothetical protein
LGVLLRTTKLDLNCGDGLFQTTDHCLSSFCFDKPAGLHPTAVGAEPLLPP